jgi:hypothetical protein
METANKFSIRLIVLLLLALTAIEAVSLYDSAFTKAEYTYKIVNVPDSSFDSSMNYEGVRGWELVTARRASDGSTYSPTFSYECIFKKKW